MLRVRTGLALLSLLSLLWACAADPLVDADAGGVTPAHDAATDADAADAALNDATETDAAPDATTETDAADGLDATPPDANMTPRSIHAYGALGSSSTAGSGASAPDRAYVALLHARLQARAASVTLINRGQGGARIDTLLAALPELERARPELLTVLPLSDFVQTDEARFRSGYDELFRRLGAVGTTIFFGNLQIDPAYLCQGGVSGPGGCYGEQDRALLAGKNTIVLELAALYPAVVVVPVFDQNAAHPEWNAADGHPNDLGHTYLADTFWAAIAPWLDGP